MRRSRPSSTAGLHPSTVPRPLPPPDSDISELRDYLSETRDFASLSIPKLISVHDHMPTYIKSCLAERDFPRAKAGDRFRRALQSELQRQCHLLNSRRPRSDTHRRPSNDPLLHDFDRETAERERALASAHSRSLAQFDDGWRKKAQTKYRKPSGELRGLRIRQRELEIAGDADGAARLREEADGVEALEREAALEKFAGDYRAAKERLRERLEGEARALRGQRERLRAALVARSRGIASGGPPVVVQKRERGVRLPPLRGSAEQEGVFVSPVKEGLAELTEQETREEEDQTEGSGEEEEQNQGTVEEVDQNQRTFEEADQIQGNAEEADQTRESVEEADQSQETAEEADQTEGKAEKEEEGGEE